MVEGLWSIPAADNIRAPSTIMKEQATALTLQTGGSLVGLVETGAYGAGDLAINLSIQVPSLDNYKYRLMTYTQPITMYRGTLAAQVPVASGTRACSHLEASGAGKTSVHRVSADLDLTNAPPRPSQRPMGSYRRLVAWT
jgi:hypothetical protein